MLICDAWLDLFKLDLFKLSNFIQLNFNSAFAFLSFSDGDQSKDSIFELNIFHMDLAGKTYTWQLLFNIQRICLSSMAYVSAFPKFLRDRTIYGHHDTVAAATVVP